MERPTQDLPSDPVWLPNQFRYLLQRVHAEAQRNGEMATILFDGNGLALGGLARRFESFLFRSNEGRSLTGIADAPYFVDSKITAGIQIADLVTSVVRQFEENELFRGCGTPIRTCRPSVGTTGSLKGLTEDLETEEGALYGFYRMPERAHYTWDHTELAYE